jgi:hypothetical protein
VHGKDVGVRWGGLVSFAFLVLKENFLTYVRDPDSGRSTWYDEKDEWDYEREREREFIQTHTPQFIMNLIGYNCMCYIYINQPIWS